MYHFRDNVGYTWKTAWVYIMFNCGEAPEVLQLHPSENATYAEDDI
jgi:hypothetical protein